MAVRAGRAVLVTGASSGIGAAIARRYAVPGCTLSLWGRDAGRLRGVAEQAREAGARVSEVVLDLADAAAALRLAEDEDAATPFDTVVLAAGVGGVRPAGQPTEDPAAVARIAAVNFLAPVALATCLAGRMAARGGGRIALIGSTAAFLPLPQAPAYASSKAGLAAFAKALRVAVRGSGVAVTLISPGFIDTPMSRSLDCAKPFLMPVEKAADRIVSAIEHRRNHTILPGPFALLPLIAGLTPAFLRDRLLLRLDARPM